MNKPLIAGSLVLGLAATSAFAQQTRDTDTQADAGFIDYFGAQLAISDPDGFDNGMALVITGGNNVRGWPNFSIEGEATSIISKPEAEVGGISADLSYWTLAGYGVYALPVGQDFALRGRLGVLYESLDVSGPGDDKDEFGVSLGVGGTYTLSPRLNLIGEYTRIEEDINHLSAGVQFKF